VANGPWQCKNLLGSTWVGYYGTTTGMPEATATASSHIAKKGHLACAVARALPLLAVPVSARQRHIEDSHTHLLKEHLLRQGEEKAGSQPGHQLMDKSTRPAGSAVMCVRCCTCCWPPRTAHPGSCFAFRTPCLIAQVICCVFRTSQTRTR
jgi:hypothetical protein